MALSERHRMTWETNLVLEFLTSAGVKVGGNEPWDIQIHEDRFFSRVVAGGSLGFGEAYMDGWWSCAEIDTLCYRLLAAGARSVVRFPLKERLRKAFNKCLNPQTKHGARRVISCHYELGNEFFERMLDKRMIYSCAYWKGSDNLDDAQEAKLRLVCRKLALAKSDRVLDIGCGWGGFLKYAAEQYGCEAVGITLSKKQADYAISHCSALPVQLYASDYRDFRAEKLFDKVVSLGMLEHVGPRNYFSFFQMIKRCMSPKGLCLVQTIGDNVCCDPWLEKYIFPGGVAPSMSQLSTTIEAAGFVVEDWHNFGPDYYRTLTSWCHRFRENWNVALAPEGLDPRRFFRMWEYYLMSFSAGFKARNLQLWQIVLSLPAGVQEYESIR